MIPITVIIPTKNGFDNLKLSFPKLIEFSQVIIVDSNSKDGTKELVEGYNFEYVNFNWNGSFPKKRNWALENLVLNNDWILFLDADEYLTDKFIEEIKVKILNTKYDAFLLYYSNYFQGVRLRFGDRMQKIALVKSYLRYEYIDLSNCSDFDMEIHEHPIGYTKLGKIKSLIEHNDFKGINSYILKHNGYSNWEAERYLSGLNRGNLTFRQKVKYLLLNLGLLPFFYFVWSFFIKLGIFDGINGFNFAMLKSYYFFSIKLKIKYKDFGSK